MNVMKIKNIMKSFGDKEVLKGISFQIDEQDRIGLVGYNGQGKTTLANIITGTMQPDEGSIELFKPVKIGYLFQSTEYQLMDYQKGVIELDNKDFFTFASQLGLDKIQKWSDEKYAHLSGGEKLKLVLAQLWNSKPDFLVLDEPTNHLDLQGINWLLEELNSFKGPVLIISHDRYFLDQIVKTTLELEDGLIHHYNGNYSQYKIEKMNRKEIQLQQYSQQQKYKAKIEDQMEQLSKWSDKAHRQSTKLNRDMGYKEHHRVKAKKVDRQVKSKMKRLEKELDQNKIEKPKEDPTLNFHFHSGNKKGKRVIEAKNIEKAFNDQCLFRNSHFYIKQGEKIGIIGPNGCGKSTLISIIMGDERLSAGEIWKGTTLKLAYLSQELLDLNIDQTVLESFGPLDRDQLFEARTYLASMGLPRKITGQRIETLSLGERVRVKLVDMLIKEYDVLVLDEPTNHLDLPSREQLEKTLSQFPGTIITVSHDYYFIEKICDKLLVFENQQIRRIESSLNEYMNRNKHSKSTEVLEEELMILENRLSQVLGDLSLLTPTDVRYAELDAEFNEILKAKKDLLARKK